MLNHRNSSMAWFLKLHKGMKSKFDLVINSKIMFDTDSRGMVYLLSG